MGVHARRVFWVGVFLFGSVVAYSLAPLNLNRHSTTPIHIYDTYWTDDSNDTDFASDASVDDVTSALDPVHDLYLDLGFKEPGWFLGFKEVLFNEEGANIAKANIFNIVFQPSQTNSMSESTLRLITLHEMFHHEQYAYLEQINVVNWGNWLMEATARMMQDKMFSDFDSSTSNTGGFTFYAQLGSYLGNSNQDLMASSYDACLFWHYLTEQFGGHEMTTLQASDPDLHLGVDFLRRFFDRAVGETPDTLGVLEELIEDIDSSRDFESVWQDFTIANYLKDYSVVIPGVPVYPPLYGYQDDDGSGQNYPTVTTIPVGTLRATATTQIVNVTHWGAQYIEAAIPSNALVYGVQINSDEKASLAVALVNSSNQAVSLYKVFDDELKQAYYYDRDHPISTMAVVVAGLDEELQAEAVMVAGKAALSIERPTLNSPEFVGSATEPQKFIVKLRVTGPPELEQFRVGFSHIHSAQTSRWHPRGEPVRTPA